MSELDQAPALLSDIRSYTARYGRRWTSNHAAWCAGPRDARRESTDNFAEEMADVDGQAYYPRQREPAVKQPQAKKCVAHW